MVSTWSIFCKFRNMRSLDIFRRGKNRLEMDVISFRQVSGWQPQTPFGVIFLDGEHPRYHEKLRKNWSSISRVALAFLMQWYEFSEKKTGTKNTNKTGTKKNLVPISLAFSLALGNMLWCLTALLLIGSYFMWLLVGLEGGGLLTSRSLSDIDTKYKTSRKPSSHIVGSKNCTSW